MHQKDIVLLSTFWMTLLGGATLGALLVARAGPDAAGALRTRLKGLLGVRPVPLPAAAGAEEERIQAWFV